jgi:hypothetical protein
LRIPYHLSLTRNIFLSTTQHLIFFVILLSLLLLKLASISNHSKVEYGRLEDSSFTSSLEILALVLFGPDKPHANP